MDSFEHSKCKLATIAYAKYDDLVNQVCTQQISDTVYIEYILKMLLEFCYNVDMVFLYRTLIRYLDKIDSEIASKHTKYFEENWGYDLFNYIKNNIKYN